MNDKTETARAVLKALAIQNGWVLRVVAVARADSLVGRVDSFARGTDLVVVDYTSVGTVRFADLRRSGQGIALAVGRGKREQVAAWFTAPVPAIGILDAAGVKRLPKNGRLDEPS
jgi:hypothetical protein